MNSLSLSLALLGRFKGLATAMGLLALLAATSPNASAQIVYVDIGLAGSANPGLNNGDSWQNAYHSLHSGLTDPDVQSGAVGQVWVAKGTYVPDITGLSDPKAATFTVRNGLQLIGGFENGESDPDDRDPLNYEQTILDGKLVTGSDKSYHVVFAQPGQNKTYLDGFLIKNGFARGEAGSLPDDATRQGGGVYASGTDLKLRNLFLNSNFALERGGGVFFTGGLSDRQLQVFRCEFDSNSVGKHGGGLYMESFQGEPGFIDSTHVYNSKFRRNLAGFSNSNGEAVSNQQGGGGLAIGPRSQLAFAFFANNLFTQNYVRGYGSAVWHSTNLGFAVSPNGRFAWSNCTFHANVVISEPQDTSGPVNVIYTTGTFTADGQGAMRNSIFWDNPRNVSFQGQPDGVTDGGQFVWTQEHCDLQITLAGTLPAGQGNISQDPLFNNPVLMDYGLAAGSPCLDTGSDDLFVPDFPDGDEDGNFLELIEYEYDPTKVRSSDEVNGQTCAGSTYTCGESDMGAFERQ